MIAQIIEFESSLSEEEALSLARKRLPEFQAIPSLIQKYYLKLEKPGCFAGFYIWESMEALEKYRNSDLAKSIPEAYKIVGEPRIRVLEVAFPLRA